MYAYSELLHPTCRVKCVVGGRLLSVVQPEHKIMLTHILPEHEVLFVTQLSMHSSMCLSNVGVELSWCYRRTSRQADQKMQVNRDGAAGTT